MPYLRARRVAAFWRRRKRRTHGGGKLPPTAAGVPVFTGGNKRGQDTKYGFLSPLDSPHLPLRCDSLRSRSETGVTGARFRASGRFWDAVRP